jgi:hypothetical protein
MTKEQYFDLCEQMGSEPVDSEIPIEFDDLTLDVQEALRMYNQLQDNWDYMGGNYIGKSYIGLMDIMNILEVDPADRRTMYELIGHIDRIRAKAISDSKPKK